MKYTKLNELQNSYPKDQITIKDNYSTEAGNIRLTGKFPENFLIFETIKVDDTTLGQIQVSPNANFRFVVKFKDGNGNNSDDMWTSQQFLDDLRNSNTNSNPYFDREHVTTAVIDYQVLNEYWKLPKFVGKIGTKDVDGFGEAYAEVKITETLDTKEEMLKHIDWMVSSAEELRPVNTFGQWNVETTEALGFSEEFLTFYDGSSLLPSEEDLTVSDGLIDRPDEDFDRRDPSGSGEPRNS